MERLLTLRCAGGGGCEISGRGAIRDGERGVGTG